VSSSKVASGRVHEIASYSQLISLAVHEFRTPASVVGGYLRMLKRDGGDPLTPQQRKMIDEAEKSCGRLVEMIAQLSDIGKLDGGLIALARQPVDVFAIAAEVAEPVHKGDDREVRVTGRGETTGGVREGDAPRLRAAFDAILRAIVREKAGPCTVVAERRLVVDDAGTSAVVVIAEDSDVQSVYTSPPGPFDDRRGGLGLALPLAVRVIEGHGGRLWSPAAVDGQDARARGSAVVSLPITESSR
jgi:signal transduction histidine kinase